MGRAHAALFSLPTFRVRATNFIRRFTGDVFRDSNACVTALPAGTVRFTVGRLGYPGAMHVDMDVVTAVGVAARLLGGVHVSQATTPEALAQLDEVEKYVRALRGAAKAD